MKPQLNQTKFASLHDVEIVVVIVLVWANSCIPINPWPYLCTLFDKGVWTPISKNDLTVCLSFQSNINKRNHCSPLLLIPDALTCLCIWSILDHLNSKQYFTFIQWCIKTAINTVSRFMSSLHSFCTQQSFHMCNPIFEKIVKWYWIMIKGEKFIVMSHHSNRFHCSEVYKIRVCLNLQSFFATLISI